MTNKSMKRIHKVVVKRMFDESPDTSWLGEYASKSTSEFSIDRQHSLDCPVNTPHIEAYKQMERVLHYLDRIEANDALSDACDILVQAMDEINECDCDERGDMGRNEYQYFNPSFNYVDKSGHALAENTPDEVQKYVRQDYERMQLLHRGDWSYMGIRADAEYHIDTGHGHSIIQSVTSGGLWGIESDSDASYFAEVEADELAALRTQLAAIGFSKRAIAAAFKSVEHVDAG